MRNLRNRIVPLALLAIAIFGCSQVKKNNSYEVVSPDGKNKIKFELIENEPKYAVYHDTTEVLTFSNMGFLLKNNKDLSKNFEVTNIENSSFDETWKQVWGEKKGNS